MGHRRRRGAWGRPRGLGGVGTPEPQLATDAAAVGPGAARRAGGRDAGEERGDVYIYIYIYYIYIQYPNLLQMFANITTY